MYAVIAFILGLFVTLFPVKSDEQLFVAYMAPESVEQISTSDCSARGDCDCWACYDLECYVEAGDEFTRLFNATEVKWAKNGRLMVKGANSKSFKFVGKGK